MKDPSREKHNLLAENALLKQRIHELELLNSDRKRVEEALQESGQWLNSIIDGSPIPAFVIGKDHRIIHWNNALEEMSKIKSGEIVGTREHWKAFYKEERPCMADLLVDEAVELVPQWYSEKYIRALLIEGAYKGTDYFPALGQDGKWLRFTAVAIRDSKGTIVAAIETLEDITERKRAAVALQESEERYHRIADAVTDYIFTSTIEDGKVVKTVHGPGCIAVTGYSAEEFTAEPYLWLNMVFPEDSDLVRQYASRVLAGKNFDPIEHRIRKKDGSVRWVLNTPVPHYDSSGALVSYDGLISDITLRKQAEEALRESNRRLDDIIDFLPDATFVIDREGKVIAWNKAIEQMTGVPKAQMIGKGDYEYAIPFYGQRRQLLIDLTLLPDEEFEQNHYEGVYRQGDILNAEAYVPQTYAGKGASLWGTASKLHNASGEVIGAIESIRDVTERKRADEEKRILEERLQRAEKMEALGQLAGKVAHDLNNVLGILSGYSELLLYETPLGHRSRGYAEKILQSTETGASIIQDLLTLARRGVSTSDVININSVVSGFFKSPVFEKLKDNHPLVSFRTEYDRDLLNIKGSAVHLEKTLMNLVSNAAESISGRGEVTVSTQSRYLDRAVRGYDEVREGDYAVLTVSDTGMGIPAENIEKIFEPFFTKKAMGRSGTGLGLAIVWGTVKDHKGYIDIATKVAEGTTFTLYFPATRDELIALQQKEPIERYAGNGETVLVVDDVAEQRSVASGLLTRLGYRVHAVSSGEEAVAYLKESRADILVLDMIMAPGIDGLETYQRVLEFNPKQKAVLVSGFSETDRVREAQKLGARAYIKKPYVMEKIGMAIRDELNR